MKINYKHTMYACFTGLVVQAIINNFVPLLFLTFQSSYGIPITKITFLVTFNFGLQLVIDFLSPGIIDKVGYRVSIVAAHVFAAAGFVALVILPEVFADPFVGLLIAIMIYALGGGLLEVLVSPIMEACPSDNKESAMSLLHSFYCWGHMGVVLLSTLFFVVFGIGNWKVLAVCWAIIPILNGLFFGKVPIANLIEEGEQSLSVKALLSNKLFWIMIVLMTCSGASEQAVSQWASTLAEKGLLVSKTVGDLAGPMLFAITMGTSRVLYSKFGEKIRVQTAILCCAILCLFSYLLIALTPYPVFGFVGCAISGFSVGVLWPGTFSMGAAEIRNGGTMMFAYFALAGDLGCSLGPTLVGRVSGIAGDSLQMGILAASIFPILLITAILVNMRCMKKTA